MDTGTQIEVVDRYGWRKGVPLTKPIVNVGTDLRNDIVLESTRGAGVLPLHAQLIASPATGGYSLVNLAETGISLGSAGDGTLAPRTAVMLREGLVFRLGEFTLVFRAGSASGVDIRVDSPVAMPPDNRTDGAHIGLNLRLPGSQLRPYKSLHGVLRVSNLGDRSGAQFELELEGLEPDCYEIEPGPSLASGAEMEVALRLHHRGNRPLAGQRKIVIRATAEQAYPGEEISVSQTIEILPCFQHRLRVIPPTESGRLQLPAPREAPMILLDAAEVASRGGDARTAAPVGMEGGVSAPAQDQSGWWAPTAAPAPMASAAPTQAPAPAQPSGPTTPKPVMVEPVVTYSDSEAIPVPADVGAASGGPPVSPAGGLDVPGGVGTEPAAPAPPAGEVMVALPESERSELAAATETALREQPAAGERPILSSQPLRVDAVPEQRSPAPIEPALTREPPAASSAYPETGPVVVDIAPDAAASRDWWIEEPVGPADMPADGGVLRMSAARAAVARTASVPDAAPNPDWWTSGAVIQPDGAEPPPEQPEIRAAVRLGATTARREDGREPDSGRPEPDTAIDPNPWASGQ